MAGDTAAARMAAAGAALRRLSPYTLNPKPWEFKNVVFEDVVFDKNKLFM